MYDPDWSDEVSVILVRPAVGYAQGFTDTGEDEYTVLNWAVDIGPADGIP